MKQYYKANINGLKVKNLILNNNNVLTLEFSHTIIKNGAIYFRNIGGRLIEADTGCPTNTLYEAREWLEGIANKHPDIEEMRELPAVQYIDNKTLTPISITKEQEKILKKERKAKK